MKKKTREERQYTIEYKLYEGFLKRKVCPGCSGRIEIFAMDGAHSDEWEPLTGIIWTCHQDGCSYNFGDDKRNWFGKHDTIRLLTRGGARATND